MIMRIRSSTILKHWSALAAASHRILTSTSKTKESIVSSNEYILRYLKWLEILNYPMDKFNLQSNGISKSFPFGSDVTEQSKWIIELY